MCEFHKLTIWPEMNLSWTTCLPLLWTKKLSGKHRKAKSYGSDSFCLSFSSNGKLVLGIWKRYLLVALCHGSIHLEHRSISSSQQKVRVETIAERTSSSYRQKNKPKNGPSRLHITTSFLSHLCQGRADAKHALRWAFWLGNGEIPP
jgi:hypothetical protein